MRERGGRCFEVFANAVHVMRGQVVHHENVASVVTICTTRVRRSIGYGAIDMSSRKPVPRRRYCVQVKTRQTLADHAATTETIRVINDPEGSDRWKDSVRSENG